LYVLYRLQSSCQFWRCWYSWTSSQILHFLVFQKASLINWKDWFVLWYWDQSAYGHRLK
jgi:hypothetical protein